MLAERREADCALIILLEYKEVVLLDRHSVGALDTGRSSLPASRSIHLVTVARYRVSVGLVGTLPAVVLEAVLARLVLVELGLRLPLLAGRAPLLVGMGIGVHEMRKGGLPLPSDSV